MSSLETQALRLHSVKAHVCKEVCLLDQSLSLPAVAAAVVAIVAAAAMVMVAVAAGKSCCGSSL